MVHASESFLHDKVGWTKQGIENLILSILHHNAFAELLDEKFDSERIADLTGFGSRILMRSSINDDGQIETLLILQKYNKVDHSFTTLERINASQNNIFRWFWEHRHYIHCFCGSVGWNSDKKEFVPFAYLD